MMADEGIHEPIIEGNKRTKAEIRAKEAGTLAGLYVADILIREWMPGPDLLGRLQKDRG